MRREIGDAQKEMWSRAKAAAPAFGLLGSSGVLALVAGASSYRYALRLLEKKLSPTKAAFVAMVVSGGAAAAAGAAGVRRLREVGPPLPTQTARRTEAVVAQAADEASAVAGGQDLTGGIDGQSTG